MDNEIPNNHKQVLSKDLNRETLFKLFFDNNILSIGVDKIGMTKEEQPLFKEREVRYGAEKLLFLHLLMDSNLKNQIEQRKNVKYDYMIGLLLYILRILISNIVSGISEIVYNHSTQYLPSGVNFWMQS